MRKLASIVEIETCEPIVDSNRLSVATMVGKGWRVVTGRNEFKPGDVAVYFEIDSALPSDDERYAFLRERCLKKFVSRSGNVLREVIRIKTAKLRGVISQGLLIPIDRFPEITDNIINKDVSDLLHVEHYDEIAEQMKPITGGAALSGDGISNFPDKWAPRSDENRIQNVTEYFETMKGRRFEVTEKFDGTSTSVAYSPTIDAENPFMVCSRNIRLKEFTSTGVMPIYWLMARKYDLERKLKEHYEKTGTEWMLQLETVGCGINGNHDRYTDNQMFCFRIWDITNQKFVDPAVRRDFCKVNQIPHVKVIATDMPFFDIITNVDKALEFADGKTDRGNVREGIVLKSSDEGSFVSFKIVSNRYLLKQED